MQELFVYFVLFERLSLAFGNKIAKVDTTLLNRRATYASALPTGCTTLAPIGDPSAEHLGRKTVRSTPY